MACQMTPAILDQTSVDVTAGEYLFRATGSIVEFPGFMVLYVEGRENDESEEGGEGLLPDLKEGQPLTLEDLVSAQHFTQPPPPVFRGEPHQGTRRTRNRPAEHLCHDPVDDRGAGIRHHPQSSRLFPTELGWLINGLMVAKLSQCRGRGFHRANGKKPG